MSPNSSPSESFEKVYGEWSDIESITTKDPQTIDPDTALIPAIVTVQGKETIIDFEKSGKLTAKNEYEFGRTSWDVKIPQQMAHQAPFDSNSFIKVGVTIGTGKNAIVFGTLFNYGLNTESTTIKLLLDVDCRTLNSA